MWRSENVIYVYNNLNGKAAPAMLLVQSENRPTDGALMSFSDVGEKTAAAPATKATPALATRRTQSTGDRGRSSEQRTNSK